MRRPGFVVGAAVASHLPALGAGYVWLDHAHIEDGAAIARPADFLGLFTHGFAGTGYYRPLVSLALSLDALVGGASVMHVTSVVWHAVASVMVMLAAEALGLARRSALGAALLFAVHPLSALVADAIAFRSEAMLVASLMTLLWAHRNERPALAAAALAFAALTKETGLVLGPLLVLALGRHTRRLYVPEGAALALALGARLLFAPAWRAPYAAMSAADQIGTRLASVAKSAAAVLGVERSICDAFAITHPWQPTALAGSVALVVLAVFAWKRRGITLLLALAVLPALQLVPVTRWWSPHYLYLPLAFAAMLVAARVEHVRFAPLVLAALGALTCYDSLRYHDDTSLWTPEVKHQPACREAQFYLGEVERSARRWDAAGKRYEAALAERADMLAFVDRGAALQNLGTVRFEQRRYADAIAAYEKALEGTADEQRRRELTYNISSARARAARASE